MEEQVEWLRPEFEGREKELISLSALARQENVSPSTVTSWQNRHAGFPAIVMIHRGHVTTKYISVAEFAAYKRAKAEAAKQPRARKKQAARRPAAVIAKERLDALQAEDRRLEAEEKALSEQLAAVLRRRHAISAEQKGLRQQLQDELAAIQEALGTEEP
ncbi:hypothetical protein [Streptomyces sp. NPDC004528]|uniref:hypothetical protein n=1 Tax=Streptomyces sp. NPDC004528 TaxID=3154550 RepID=UPI0033B82768